MFFSFLVPVYNTEKYLKQCIDSLLIQKGAAFEIILLDDGSTDSSPQICDTYAAAHPDLVKVIHKENEGLLLTRRRGFREASGDWFLCIDSDDYAAPNLLETVVATITAHASCDMVMYNYHYVDDQGVFSPSRLTLEDGSVFNGERKQQLYEMRLTSTSINNMWLRAIHRSIVDIDADYSQSGIRNMCEDALQVLPLYTNTIQTVYVDRPLYYYRKNSSSITGRTSFAHWQAIFRSFVLEEPYAAQWNVPVEVQHNRCTKQLENICNCVRWLYMHQGDRSAPAVSEVLPSVKTESLFRICLEQYDRQYASSRYSALSMPIIAAAVNQERVRFLRCFFLLESWLRRK